jgi:cellulose biosynthesis protein BcsQ
MNHQMEFKIINCHINLSAIELMAFNLYEFVTLLTSLFDNYDFFSL